MDAFYKHFPIIRRHHFSPIYARFSVAFQCNFYHFNIYNNSRPFVHSTECILFLNIQFINNTNGRHLHEYLKSKMTFSAHRQTKWIAKKKPKMKNNNAVHSTILAFKLTVTQPSSSGLHAWRFYTRATARRMCISSVVWIQLYDVCGSDRIWCFHVYLTARTIESLLLSFFYNSFSKNNNEMCFCLHSLPYIRLTNRYVV